MVTGKIIKLLRVASGLSQGELATNTGVSSAYLSQVESGKREAGLNFLRQLAAELKVPVQVLLPTTYGDLEPELASKFRALLIEILAAKLEQKNDDED